MSYSKKSTQKYFTNQPGLLFQFWPTGTSFVLTDNQNVVDISKWLCVGTKLGAEKPAASDLINWDEGVVSEKVSSGTDGGWGESNWESVDIKSGKSD